MLLLHLPKRPVRVRLTDALFADTTVQPGTEYEYTILPENWHYNPGPLGLP